MIWWELLTSASNWSLRRFLIFATKFLDTKSFFQFVHTLFIFSPLHKQGIFFQRLQSNWLLTLYCLSFSTIDIFLSSPLVRLYRWGPFGSPSPSLSLPLSFFPRHPPGGHSLIGAKTPVPPCPLLFVTPFTTVSSHPRNVHIYWIGLLEVEYQSLNKSPCKALRGWRLQTAVPGWYHGNYIFMSEVT